MTKKTNAELTIQNDMSSPALILSTAAFFFSSSMAAISTTLFRVRTEVSPSDLITADEDDDIIPGIEVPNDHIKRDIVLGADFVSVVSVDD